MTAGRITGLAILLAGLLSLVIATSPLAATSPVVATVPARAVTFGLDWNGDNSLANLDAVVESGATLYHVPLAYGDWPGDEALVTAAWERGLTVMPTIVRTGATGNRFLLPSDPEWGTWGLWAQQLVERFGTGGSFWEGKVNPTPITSWEVWNEPNLPANDPLRSEAECAAIRQVFYRGAETCVQPASYGTFLAYTAEHMQAGSIALSGRTTNVLMGGLNLELGEGFASFLQGAADAGGLSEDVTGVAIHPYSFGDGLIGLIEGVAGVRRYLDAQLRAGEKTLAITEFGWPVAGSLGMPAGGTPVSEAEQAELLTSSFEWIRQVAAADKIELATWYALRDFASGAHWDGYAGLLREDGTPRPSWYAFEDEMGAKGGEDR